MIVSIVGCGNIGFIYAQAFLKYQVVKAHELFLIEKNESRRTAILQQHTGTLIDYSHPSFGKSDILIIAVKPQDFKEVAQEIKKRINPQTLVLSIMAGVKIEKLKQSLGHSRIIRAMPNSPIELGMGITGYMASEEVEADLLQKAENLMATTGRYVQVQEEDHLNAITAISGSGPAYFFYFVKTLTEAAVEMEIPPTIASLLVKQTMLGAYHLMNSSDKPLDELIKTVASRGGTTEAALSTFKEGELDKLILAGLMNARKRSRELSAS